MSERILVTYASCTGSTIGVAEAIGKGLKSMDSVVDVRPMSEVRDVRGYDAVVVGSAVQGSKCLPEAVEFIQAHRKELLKKPFAAFCVCMTMALLDEDKIEKAAVEKFLAPVRALVPTVSEGYFAGALDIDSMPGFWTRFAFRLSTLLGIWQEGDHRDWEAIDAWAHDLKHRLVAAKHAL